MARKAVDWKLGVKGPSWVEGFKTMKLGLAVRHYCSENGVAPGGKLLRAAAGIAASRDNKFVWLEDIQAALGVPVKEQGDVASKLRGKQARARYRSAREEREAAAEAKREARRTKAANRKAAKAAAPTA